MLGPWVISLFESGQYLAGTVARPVFLSTPAHLGATQRLFLTDRLGYKYQNFALGTCLASWLFAAMGLARLYSLEKRFIHCMCCAFPVHRGSLFSSNGLFQRRGPWSSDP